MRPPLIDALQEELREERDGAILTNAIAILEFFDPNDGQRTIVVMGSGADGSPITPWLSMGMINVALSTGIVSSFAEVPDDEEEEDDE